VRAHAAAHGLDLQVKRFAASTRTAEDAAREIGTTVERIVKSLVFDAAGEAVLVLCSGAARVDTNSLAAVLDAPPASVRRATADEAKRASGYAIGGVPPFGHAGPLRVLLDEGLLQFDVVWAASGLPDAVFPIAPDDLLRASGATVVKVAG